MPLTVPVMHMLAPVNAGTQLVMLLQSGDTVPFSAAVKPAPNHGPAVTMPFTATLLVVSGGATVSGIDPPAPAVVLATSPPAPDVVSPVLPAVPVVPVVPLPAGGVVELLPQPARKITQIDAPKKDRISSLQD
jgi:hypothetical protein